MEACVPVPTHIFICQQSTYMHSLPVPYCRRVINDVLYVFKVRAGPTQLAGTGWDVPDLNAVRPILILLPLTTFDRSPYND